MRIFMENPIQIEDIKQYKYILTCDTDRDIMQNWLEEWFKHLEKHLEAVKRHAKSHKFKKVNFELHLSMRAYKHMQDQIVDRQSKKSAPPIDYNKDNLFDIDIKVIGPEPKIETLNTDLDFSVQWQRAILFELKYISHLK